MGAIASEITSFPIVYSTFYSDADQRIHQSSAWLAFVWGIHRSPVNSPHKWPVTRKMFPFDDVIMMCTAGQHLRKSFNSARGMLSYFQRQGTRLLKQSGRSPKVVALSSATNFSSYIIELLQLHDTIQIQWNYAWIHYYIAKRSHLMI